MRDEQLTLRASKARPKKGEGVKKQQDAGRGGRGKGRGRGGRGSRGGRKSGRGCGSHGIDGADGDVYFPPSQAAPGDDDGDQHGVPNENAMSESDPADVQLKTKPEKGGKKAGGKAGKQKNELKDKASESKKAGKSNVVGPKDGSDKDKKALEKQKAAGPEDESVGDEAAGKSKSSGYEDKSARSKVKTAGKGGCDEEAPKAKKPRVPGGVVQQLDQELDDDSEANLLKRDFGVTGFPLTFAGRYCPKNSGPKMKWEALVMGYKTQVEKTVPEGARTSEIQDGC
jgi:hypothetical protein